MKRLLLALALRPKRTGPKADASARAGLLGLPALEEARANAPKFS